MLSGEHPEDIEIKKERSIHPFNTTQAFVLGMQKTHFYYYTLEAINAYDEYSTFYQIYTDAQIVIRDFITHPIIFPGIRLPSIEHYYGALLLLFYYEANERANDETRHEYERHLEAAVLYRMAYLVGEEYMEENEDTEATTIPFLLEQLATQAFAEERYLADLINPERHTNVGTHAFLAPPDTPEYVTDEEALDLPELEPYAEDEIPEEHLNEALDAIRLMDPYVTWPPNNESIRTLIREGLILPTSAEDFIF